MSGESFKKFLKEGKSFYSLVFIANGKFDKVSDDDGTAWAKMTAYVVDKKDLLSIQDEKLLDAVKSAMDKTINPHSYPTKEYAKLYKMVKAGKIRSSQKPVEVKFDLGDEVVPVAPKGILFLHTID